MVDPRGSDSLNSITPSQPKKHSLLKTVAISKAVLSLWTSPVENHLETDQHSEIDKVVHRDHLEAVPQAVVRPCLSVT